MGGFGYLWSTALNGDFIPFVDLGDDAFGIEGKPRTLPGHCAGAQSRDRPSLRRRERKPGCHTGPNLVTCLN